jgi:hypothetical protein
MTLESLNRKYDTSVLSAFIIYLPTVELSVRMAERCLASCRTIGQRAELYEGFNGTNNQISVPKHLENQGWIKWLKITDHFQSSAEIACSLSHISLWVKSMEEDRPIIILEHDAVMVKPYPIHKFYNIISYLGCVDQKFNSNLPFIPTHSAINNNWHFINRAHAYCIDPPTAKRLFTNVLDRGIFESLDVMIKCDDVGIIQDGFYAYEISENLTTIPTRKKTDDHRKLR